MSASKNNKSHSQRKAGRAKKSSGTEEFKGDLWMKEDENQDYAIVTKVLGGSRFTLACLDGKIRVGVLPGRYKNSRARLGGGMTKLDCVVLFAKRGFEDKTADILWTYSEPQKKKLISQGELPSGISVASDGKISSGGDDSKDEKKEEECPFDFEAI